MTNLRTKWGLDLRAMKNIVNYEMNQKQINTLEKYLSSSDINYSNQVIYITRKGQEIVDQIASELFII